MAPPQTFALLDDTSVCGETIATKKGSKLESVESPRIDGELQDSVHIGVEVNRSVTHQGVILEGSRTEINSQ